MIYSIIFLIGGILIIAQGVYVIFSLRSSSHITTSTWHIITPQSIHKHLIKPLSEKTHDILKKIVYTTLRWYQSITAYMRKKVRKFIARILHAINK